ncbi:MAG: carboxypeptidase regulatory-like domain-containing protein [Gemmatimonadetes bacterium]|nr:carboxypeptidase regulatory-like domain-containing protein [Gemmatimonadota bacterium]
MTAVINSCNEGWTRILLQLALLQMLTMTVAVSTDAQLISGQIVDSTTGVPVATGFVVLLDEYGIEIARTVSTGQGRFTLRAPRSGTYLLRSERIGYRVSVSQPLRLEAGRTLEYTLQVAALPVRLSDIEVQRKDECRIRPEAGRQTAILWEEARKALAGASWTLSQTRYRYNTVVYQRDLDVRRRRVSAEQTSNRSGYSLAPFSSVAAEQLASGGYAVLDDDNTYTYYAPDANVLQDDSFLSTHCFRVVRDTRGRPSLVGLAFEPVPGRQLTDVKGTLWIDEQSSELRSLEFSYTDLPYDLHDERIGGTVEFMPLPSGEWIVHRWQIRMPSVGMKVVHGPLGTVRRTELQGFRDGGGEILDVTDRRGRTVYSARLATLTGTLLESDRSVGVVGATVALDGTSYSATTDALGRFTITAPIEGEYRVAFSLSRLDGIGFQPAATAVTLARGKITSVVLTTPGPDSVLAAICPAGRKPSGDRAIIGVIRDVLTGAPVAGAQVIGWWQTITRGGRTGLAGLTARNHETSTESDSAGRYALCGLPNNRPIILQAVVESTESPFTEVAFAEGGVLVDESMCLQMSAKRGRGGRPLPSGPACFPQREHHATSAWVWKQDLKLLLPSR